MAVSKKKSRYIAISPTLYKKVQREIRDNPLFRDRSVSGSISLMVTLYLERESDARGELGRDDIPSDPVMSKEVLDGLTKMYNQNFESVDMLVADLDPTTVKGQQ